MFWKARWSVSSGMVEVAACSWIAPVWVRSISPVESIMLAVVVLSAVTCSSTSFWLLIAWATVTAVRSADTVEGEIALNGDRHLGQQVGGALAGVEQSRLADRLGLGRLGRVELVGLVLELLVEALGDVDHLLELVHRLPQAGALGVD